MKKNRTTPLESLKFELNGKDEEVKRKKDIEKFFFCECHAEGVWITKDAIDKVFYLSLWGNGYSPKTPRLWDRLRTCWKILTTGTAFEDQIVLSSKTAKNMANFISSNISK